MLKICRMVIIILVLTMVTASILPQNVHANEALNPDSGIIHMDKNAMRPLIPLRSTVIDRVSDSLGLHLRDGTVLRLSGIDIPYQDMNDPKITGDTVIFRQQAKNILEKTVIGKMVTIYVTPNSKTGRINRFGQKLAHIVLKSDKTWLQGLLLSHGLAYVATTPTNPELAKQMLAVEAAARAKQHGLWALPEYRPKTPDNLQNHINSYQILQGTVHSAASRRNRIYLNFGADWRTDTTITIEPKNRKYFSKSGMNPLSWSNKHIRARGWVEDYNGPYMTVTHPSQIEFIEDDIAPADMVQ